MQPNPSTTKLAMGNVVVFVVEKLVSRQCGIVVHVCEMQFIV
jgi:hypothetical protein